MAALHVPKELIEDILSRVPVKSLLRFKTASKNWYSLLSQDHKFANFHLKRSKNHLMHHANLPIIFQTSPGSSIFQSFNIDTNASRKFNFPVEIVTECKLIGSANGLICVAPYRKGGCFIWNPCTGECKKISVPIPTASSRLFGFGYDSCSDDYKIVADWGSHFRIFSLKTNSWKILEHSFRMSHNAFHLNGALHWCLNEEIAAFDLAKEVFSYIELPDEMKVINSPYQYRPSVSFWEYQGLLYLSGGKSIWVMKKYSDPKCWFKLSKFLVEHKKPLGISTLGEVVYRVKGGSGFVKSDIQGRLSNDDKSRLMSVSSPYVSSPFVYTESLISPRCFDGLQAQSEKMIKRPRKQRKTSAT